jgi:acyl carrier protein
MLDEVRGLFVETYGLDIDPDSIDPTEPLYGLASRFGLDSMDTLKFIAILHNTYGINIGSTNTDTFRTMPSIEATVRAERATARGL